MSSLFRAIEITTNLVTTCVFQLGCLTLFRDMGDQGKKLHQILRQLGGFQKKSATTPAGVVKILLCLYVYLGTNTNRPTR